MCGGYLRARLPLALHSLLLTPCCPPPLQLEHQYGSLDEALGGLDRLRHVGAGDAKVRGTSMAACGVP